MIGPASAIIFKWHGMQVAVEVSEGIKAGDEVVPQPPVNLADGDKAEISPYPRAATA